jgi:A/G-specific adenine glycosylase
MAKIQQNLNLQTEKLSLSLQNWYQESRRPLPWRASKDPYKIWISEVMLQQTTVAAVIPYYERFLKKFPTVQALAEAPLEDVLEAWAGLGYYSRARNLHASAQVLAEKGFPKTTKDLIQLKGFGPYTSRAIAALAFGEKVGVLDGNVIRVLSRLLGRKKQWWTTQERNFLQDISDQLAQFGDPSDLNQALMELGATVCTPKKALCMICPWNKHCEANKKLLVEEIPLPKPRKDREIWLWTVQVQMHRDQFLMTAKHKAPFLKKQFIFTGEFQQLSKKPKAFDLKHGITHHDIYIQIQKPLKSKTAKKVKEHKWVKKSEIKKVNPSSLLQKILGFIARDLD